MNINRKFCLTVCLIIFTGENSIYSMHFVNRCFRACSQTAYACLTLIKKNPTISAGTLCIMAFGAMHLVKHRFLHKCALHGRALQYKFWHLLGGKLDPSSPETKRAFLNAVRNNKCWLARQMLDDGIPVNDQSLIQSANSQAFNPKASALHIATLLGHTSMAKMLIDKGADVSLKDSHDKTPLHIAAYSEQNPTISENRIEIARALVKKAPLEEQDDLGYTPLHTAASNGRFEIVTMLLDNGAHIQAKTNADATPLHLAAAAGSAQTVKLLMAKKADRTAPDAQKRTPLDAARTMLKMGHFSMCDDKNTSGTAQAYQQTIELLQ